MTAGTFDVNRKWSLEYPGLSTCSVPVEPYVSADYFELERERVFRRVWLNIGRVEQIPNAGDYFVKDLAVVNDSALVVRGKDGKVRGFHNICSHRGNKLVWDESGSCRTLTCKFHGWSYNFEGRLTAVPDQEMFFDFDKSRHGLVPVATDVWAGFIFINLDPDNKETLKEYLGELGEKHAEYPFHEKTLRFTYVAELSCNWKVGVDSFSEAYHASFLHRSSTKGLAYCKENPTGRPVEFNIWKRHRSLSAYSNPNYKPGPVGAVAGRFSNPVFTAGLENLPPGVNPNRMPNWVFDNAIVFPNFIIMATAGDYLTHHFWPISMDRIIWEGDIYMEPAEAPGQYFSREYSKCHFGRDIWLEDTGTMEATHAALKSGVLKHFVLQDGELLIRHAYKVLEEHIHGREGAGPRGRNEEDHLYEQRMAPGRG
jgi:phenylpropionate dioxygenase-like ring-hydroxylating dioxygenase large terminal subunit